MDQYTSLARQAVEKHVLSGTRIGIPPGLPDELTDRTAGVFVTIFKEGQLRGCLGTIAPSQGNIADEIIENAVATATRDYRFDPIAAKELRSLAYEVSVLFLPKPLKNPKRHDPQSDGLIVKTPDGRSGLLLPDIEGVDSLQQQLEICAEKGQIDLRRDHYRLMEFKVEKHRE